MMRFMLTIIQQIILVAAATVPTIILIILDIQVLAITMTKIESGGCFGRKSSLRSNEDFGNQTDWNCTIENIPWLDKRNQNAVYPHQYIGMFSAGPFLLN